MYKKIVIATLLIFFTVVTLANASGKIKVGLALGYEGLGDFSFNDMQYLGLVEASRIYGIDVAYTIPEKETPEGSKKIINDLITQKCHLIFAAGYNASLSIKEIAVQVPDIHFVILDNPVTGIPNVTSVVYAQHEGSFVVGYLAGLFSKTKKIGFLGGCNIPVIDAFLTGFKEGVAYAGTDAIVTHQYISQYPSFTGFNDAMRGHEMALAMYEKEDVDIIYQVASATGTGIFQAAREKGLFAIGVDANQDHLAQGHVLTSMMKRLDRSIIDMVGLYMTNKLEGGRVYEDGYRNDGVSITEMKYTRELLGQEIIDKVRQVEQKIKKGEIKVTNTLYNH